jgi:hypothetical protein
MWSVTSAEMYELLVPRRGWSPEQDADYVFHTVTNLLSSRDSWRTGRRLLPQHSRDGGHRSGGGRGGQIASRTEAARSGVEVWDRKGCLAMGLVPPR